MIGLEESKMKHNALIIGDSYSTFRGYVPQGYEVYYAEEIIRETDLTDVRDTWWYQVMEEGDFRLLLNESWCGAPIGYTGYDGEDCSKSSSFIHRLRQLRDKGFFRSQEIHTVFVFGGTNDSWCEAPLGEMQLANWKEEDLYCVLPAICCFFHELRSLLPKAEIYCLINRGLKPEITRCMLESCKNHSMIPVTFDRMDTMGDHPTVKGMKEIKESVMSAINRRSGAP